MSYYEKPSIPWPPKGVSEVKDYGLNWEEAPATPKGAAYTYVPVLDVAGGETITTVSHTIKKKPAQDADNPLTIDSQSTTNDDKRTVVWLSGGVTGIYNISCRITTSAGREFCETIELEVTGC